MPITAYCKFSNEDEVDFHLHGDKRSENPEQEVQASLSKVKMDKIDYKGVQQLLNSLEVDSVSRRKYHMTLLTLSFHHKKLFTF